MIHSSAYRPVALPSTWRSKLEDQLRKPDLSQILIWRGELLQRRPSGRLFRTLAEGPHWYSRHRQQQRKPLSREGRLAPLRAGQVRLTDRSHTVKDRSAIRDLHAHRSVRKPRLTIPSAHGETHGNIYDPCRSFCLSNDYLNPSEILYLMNV
jgi:hypothetical protein